MNLNQDHELKYPSFPDIKSNLKVKTVMNSSLRMQFHQKERSEQSLPGQDKSGSRKTF